MRTLSKKQVSYRWCSKSMALLLKRHTLRVGDCCTSCRLRGYGSAYELSYAYWCISFWPDSQSHTVCFPRLKLLHDLAGNCHAFPPIFHKCLLAVQSLYQFHLQFLQEEQLETKLQAEVRLLKIFSLNPPLYRFCYELAIGTCPARFFLLSFAWSSSSRTPRW